MKICDEDKYLIATIDEQVKLLLEKGTSEITIIETLFDFIPQVLCLIKASDEAELKLYFDKFSNFAYFTNLISILCGTDKAQATPPPVS